MGKPGFPIPLPVGAPAAPTSGWDMGKPGFPNPLPVGRSPVPSPSGGGPGRGRPSQERTCLHRVRGWGNRGSPTPLPVGVPAAPTSGWDMGKPGFPNPSLWGGARFPPPAGEGLGGRSPPRKEPVFIVSEDGETGVPQPPPCGEGLGGRSLPRKQPARGRVWEGAALPGKNLSSSCQRMGKPGFPTPLPVGRVCSVVEGTVPYGYRSGGSRPDQTLRRLRSR